MSYELRQVNGMVRNEPCRAVGSKQSNGVGVNKRESDETIRDGGNRPPFVILSYLESSRRLSTIKVGEGEGDQPQPQPLISPSESLWMEVYRHIPPSSRDFGERR